MKLWVKIGLGAAGAVITFFGGKAWVDRNIYNHDGYNNLGFNRSGFDREGYDHDGYNLEGYNRAGYNKSGFDREGYNNEGYNARGYDRNGYNRYGYNEKGFDINGFDHSGYDELGYNRNGYDRSGNDISVYGDIISHMEANKQSSFVQLNTHQFRYALSDIRVGIENGIKAFLAHKLGKGYENNSLDYNIGVCEKNRFFTQDFIEKLYSAKKHCNDILHEDVEKNVDQVYFSYKVLCELTEELRIAAGLKKT